MYYTGRDMKVSHQGMQISDRDWSIFLGHAAETMHALAIPKQECDEIVSFVAAQSFPIKAKVCEISFSLLFPATPSSVMPEKKFLLLI